MKAVFVFAIIGLSIQSASADMSWHCEEIGGSAADVQVNLGERRVESPEVTTAPLGNASWDGPGDSGGGLSDVRLESITRQKSIRFYEEDGSRSFDLTIYVSGAADPSRKYHGHFSGTQSGSAPVDSGVTCELSVKDNHAQ